MERSLCVVSIHICITFSSFSLMYIACTMPYVTRPAKMAFCCFSADRPRRRRRRRYRYLRRRPRSPPYIYDDDLIVPYISRAYSPPLIPLASRSLPLLSPLDAEDFTGPLLALPPSLPQVVPVPVLIYTVAPPLLPQEVPISVPISIPEHQTLRQLVPVPVLVIPPVINNVLPTPPSLQLHNSAPVLTQVDDFISAPSNFAPTTFFAPNIVVADDNTFAPFNNESNYAPWFHSSNYAPIYDHSNQDFRDQSHCIWDDHRVWDQRNFDNSIHQRFNFAPVYAPVGDQTHFQQPITVNIPINVLNGPSRITIRNAQHEPSPPCRSHTPESPSNCEDCEGHQNRRHTKSPSADQNHSLPELPRGFLSLGPTPLHPSPVC